MTNRKNETEIATASYNFVSLLSTAVPAPFIMDENDNNKNIDRETMQKKYEAWESKSEDCKKKIYKEYVKKHGKYTGYLKLKIETLSPCFIGAVGGENKNDTTRYFFKIADKYVITGSTIRGMVKNILKIISAGAMRSNEDIEDKKLYFRCVAGKKGTGSGLLKEHYDAAMNKRGNGVEAGFLVRYCTGEYRIFKAEWKTIPAYKNPKFLEGPSVYWDCNDMSAKCVSGIFYNKKNYVEVYGADFGSDKYLHVQDEIIKSYKGDKQRAEGYDLLDSPDAKRGGEAIKFTRKNDIEFVMPCFYVSSGNEVKHFGHCQNYRVPYKYSIGEFVPKGLRMCSVDISDALFGKKNLWAGRIFFEDATANEAEEYKSELPRPLTKPNPTSYQLYLTQKGGEADNHWGKNPASAKSIRGYKFYWHNNDMLAWQKQPKDKVLKGMKKITPIEKGTVFAGKIRFQDLSDVELGALCAVFHLDTGDSDIAYKIGSGKSIGMGSVHIDTELYLEEMDMRYTRIFLDENEGWSEKVERGKAEKFILAFEKYRDAHLSEDEKPRFYISLRELSALLDYKKAVTKKEEWKEKIKTMSATDKNDTRFKDRVPLEETLTVYDKQ